VCVRERERECVFQRESECLCVCEREYVMFTLTAKGLSQQSTKTKQVL